MDETLPPTTAVIPKKIGKYDILALLDRGGMGLVYKAYDPNMKRYVAIKTIRQEISTKGSDSRAARFKAEAQSAGRLIHNRIVAAYEYDKFENVSFIAMEFIEGRSLKGPLVNGQRFTLADAVKIQYQLLDGLGFMHKNGVIHRDIKPANIMITTEGDIKITDFGIAHLDDSSLTRDGVFMGTPGYSSPEQWQGIAIDERTDVFSAGVILYQLLTGEKPFVGTGPQALMHSTLNVDPVSPSELNNLLPKEIDAVMAKALSKKPDARYPSAQAFLDSLRQVYKAKGDKGRLNKFSGMRSVLIWLVPVILGAGIVFGTLEWWSKLSITQPAAPRFANGIIDITSEPTGAVVLSSDGKLLGVAPTRLSLQPGYYQLTIEKAGYHEIEASISVDSDAVIPFFANLIEVD